MEIEIGTRLVWVLIVLGFFGVIVYALQKGGQARIMEQMARKAEADAQATKAQASAVADVAKAGSGGRPVQ